MILIIARITSEISFIPFFHKNKKLENSLWQYKYLRLLQQKQNHEIFPLDAQ